MGNSRTVLPDPGGGACRAIQLNLQTNSKENISLNKRRRKTGSAGVHAGDERKARKRKPRGDAALALAFVSNAAGSPNVESQFKLALRASPARTPALPVLQRSKLRPGLSLTWAG